MFVGHLAVALGAKRAAPRVPLAALVAATYGLDLLWPMFLLAGLERVRIDAGNTAFTPLAFDHYPWTHSLLMAAVWSSLAGLAASSWLRSRCAGLIVGATVVSHWLLDFVTHRPDLPLWPGGPKAGLSLWQSVAGTLVVEGVLLAAGVALYRRRFSARDATGRWAFWGLVGFTGVIWLSGPWAAPPPSASAVAAVALALWLFPVWAAWIERHREQ
jgi:membrane-bound metal-dependent hydrolase YbcI (DUF457 family)